MVKITLQIAGSGHMAPYSEHTFEVSDVAELKAILTPWLRTAVESNWLSVKVLEGDPAPVHEIASSLNMQICAD